MSAETIDKGPGFMARVGHFFGIPAAEEKVCFVVFWYFVVGCVCACACVFL